MKNIIRNIICDSQMKFFIPSVFTSWAMTLNQLDTILNKVTTVHNFQKAHEFHRSQTTRTEFTRKYIRVRCRKEWRQNAWNSGKHSGYCSIEWSIVPWRVRDRTIMYCLFQWPEIDIIQCGKMLNNWINPSVVSSS